MNALLLSLPKPFRHTAHSTALAAKRPSSYLPAAHVQIISLFENLSLRDSWGYAGPEISPFPR